MFSKGEVEKLAELARIKLSCEEMDELNKEIEGILAYVSEIQGVKVEEKEKSAGSHRNIMRDDKDPHRVGEFTEALLSLVPQREGDYVKVKKIL